MSDPGHPQYVAAFERVLAGGVPALLGAYEGRQLYESFDITENLLLSHNDAGRSPRNRWFSILTAGIELLGWDGWEGLRGMSPAKSLGNLLADSFALHADGDARAPLDLLPLVCREMQGACKNRHEYVVALLSELLVSALSAEDVEAKCRELNECHEEFQLWGDEHGEPNPWVAGRPEFIWGVMASRRAELRGWLELVEAHFPSSPQLAQEARERLLLEGREWRRAPHRG